MSGWPPVATFRLQLPGVAAGVRVPCPLATSKLRAGADLREPWLGGWRGRAAKVCLRTGSGQLSIPRVLLCGWICQPVGWAAADGAFRLCLP